MVFKRLKYVHLIFVLIITCFWGSCKDTKVHQSENDKAIIDKLETFRSMALKEFILENDLKNNDVLMEFFNETQVIKFDKDTIDSDLYKYLESRPNLPVYIKNSLIENHESPMMTLGELLLVLEDEVDDLIIKGTKGYSYESFSVGYKKYASEKGILSGKVWSFRYGFLWFSGQV